MPKTVLPASVIEAAFETWPTTRPSSRAAALPADLFADGGGDLLGPGDDVVGLICLSDHLQAGLLVGDPGQVDLDVDPGRARRRPGRLGSGGDVADDVAVTDRHQRLSEIDHHPGDADDLGRRPGPGHQRLGEAPRAGAPSPVVVPR